MKKVTETFTYYIPDDMDIKEVATVEEYIEVANMATTPWYDDYKYYPEKGYEHTLKIEE